MPNNVVPMPQQQAVPDDWWWDGTKWVCGGQPSCQIPPWGPFPPPFFPPQQPPWYPGANAGVSFSSDPPPFPIRGHFWWNGTLLQMFDGVTWVIVGGSPNLGKVVTTTEKFRILQPGAVTIPMSAWTVIPFDTAPTVDPDVGWDPATRKWTPKTAGVYSFVIRYVGSEAAGSYGYILARNDPGDIIITTELVVANTVSSTDPTGGYMAGSALARMNGVTDYVRLWAFSTSGEQFGFAQQPVIQAWLLP